MLSRIFCKLFNHYRPRWHVDSDCKSFCRKDNLDQPLYETFFNCFFKHGNHSSVMTRDSTGNIINKVVVKQCVFIVRGEILAMSLNNLSYLYLFF